MAIAQRTRVASSAVIRKSQRVSTDGPQHTAHPRFELASELLCLLPNRWDANGNEHYARLADLAKDLQVADQREVMELVMTLKAWDIAVERFTVPDQGRCLAIADDESFRRSQKLAAEYWAAVYGPTLAVA